MNSPQMPPFVAPTKFDAGPPDPCSCDRPSAVQTEDPFKAIADAMEAAAREADSQTQQAKQAQASRETPKRKPAGTPNGAAKREPASGVGKAAYSVAYGLGFGVAFPAYFVLGLLPPDSSVARGLRDGAQAARDSLGQ